MKITVQVRDLFDRFCFSHLKFKREVMRATACSRWDADEVYEYLTDEYEACGHCSELPELSLAD